jgi:hypothetical protein
MQILFVHVSFHKLGGECFSNSLKIEYDNISEVQNNILYSLLKCSMDHVI